MGERAEFSLSRHARRRMSQRGVTRKQIALTLEQPDRVERDVGDVELLHAIRRFGGRVLRVVYNHVARPPRVVTVYFDRRLGRRP
jgi:hypothetical protein